MNMIPKPYFIYFGEINLKIKVEAYNLEEACLQAGLHMMYINNLKEVPKVTGAEPADFYTIKEMLDKFTKIMEDE